MNTFNAIIKTERDNNYQDKESLSVVIPVYNSSITLEALLSSLTAVLSTLENRYEIILVNDGSKDESWQKIIFLTKYYNQVRGINLMRNYGQHNALLCGIREARYEIVITMDDDLQHPPTEIPKMLDKLADGYDVVYGAPQELPHSLWRNLLSRLTKRAMARAMGLQNVRDLSAFRALKTDLRKAFTNYQSPHVLLDVLLSWGTTRFTAIKVVHEPRMVGKSNYTIGSLFNQVMLMLTGFSTAPLRFASLIGFGFTFFGMLILVYVLFSYFLVGSIKGFVFLASIISLFSGAQLFALGIIGEYLARMFNRSMERPTYIVSEIIEHKIPPIMELNK